MSHITDPGMFERFNKALTSERQGYTPWYFLLSKGMKDPVAGISWKQLEGRLTFEQAIRKMRAGHNIGIAATGMDALCIVDVDDIEATPDEIVKPTLSTRSRKRIGRHYFYFTDDPRCKENLPTENKGEIRSSFEYVVAPGSFVICNDETMAAMPEAQREHAGRYTVENERAPDTIVFEELPPVFLEQAQKNKVAENEARERRKAKAQARKDKKPTQGSDKNKSAMWDLSMDDVTSIPNKARFSSLFHESTTGKNTALNSEGGLTCWRHLVTHSPLSALAVLAGVADCNSAGKGINNGKSSIIDYSDGMTLWKMWSFAKREGMIPKDDPIPAAAIPYYAVENGICKADEIIDGWKLPSGAYSRTLGAIEDKEKLATGRQIASPRPIATSTATATATKTQDVASGVLIGFFNDYLDLAQQMQKHTPIHYDSGKNYWVWSGVDKSYHHADETDILIAIQDAADLHHQIIRARDKSEMMEAIRITGRRIIPKDVPAKWIQFQDCVVDINTGERFDATPEHFFVNPIPHRCGGGTESPVIDRLIGEWVYESDREIMYEMIAYCLYTRYPIHRIFFLLGAGRNGKSQFMGIVKKLLGREGWTSSTIEMLLENRFEGAKLYKKHAVFIGETDFKMIRKTDMLKRMSGDDPIRCEFKGKTPIDFDNYAKLIIGTNSIPETADTTKGYYSRFVIIDFPNEFDLGKPVIESIPEVEYENLCNKSVIVLKQLLDAGKFTNEGTLEERKHRYIKKASSLTAFIEEHCEIDLDEVEPFWKFYDAYCIYTEATGHRTLSKTAVGRWLAEEGYEKTQERWGEKNWLTINGLHLREVKQSHLSVDSIDGVDGFPTHPPRGSQRGKLSTLSTPSTNSRPIAMQSVDGVDGLAQTIKSAIYILGYTHGLKEFNVVQLLIKGQPQIDGVTTEMLTEMLDENLAELGIIKIDDKTYKQV